MDLYHWWQEGNNLALYNMKHLHLPFILNFCIIVIISIKTVVFHIFIRPCFIPNTPSIMNDIQTRVLLRKHGWTFLYALDIYVQETYGSMIMGISYIEESSLKRLH